MPYALRSGLLALGLALGPLGVAQASVIDPGPGTLPQLQDGITGSADWVMEPAVRARQALVALDRELRAQGDVATILMAAARLSELLPDDAELAHLHALALATTGDTDASRALLDRHAAQQGDVWPQLAEALLARDAGDLVAAERAAEAAWNAEPDNAYAWNVAGTIAVAAGDYPAAVQHFERALGLAPEGAVYAANLGATLLLEGDAKAAAAALDRAVALAPDGCVALSMRAALRRDAGDPAGAHDDLQTCLAVEPGNTEAALALVGLLADHNHHAEAAELVDRHRAALPDADLLRASLALKAGDLGAARGILALIEGAEADALRALAAATRGDWANAAQIAEAAGAGMPESPAAQWLRFGLAAAAGTQAPAPAWSMPGRPTPDPAVDWLAALAAAAQGDPGPASAFPPAAQPLPGLSLVGIPPDQIARLGRSPATPWLAASTTQILLGFNRLALMTADQAVAADPELALAQLQLGLAVAAAGEASTAVAPLEMALELAPGAFSPELALGEVMIALGRFDRALRHYEAAAQVIETPAVAIRIGMIAERLGRDDIAETAFTRFIELEPNSFIGYNQLAWHLAERGRDLDRALELARRADSLQPDNASILDTIGWILHLQGNDAAAVVYLRRAHAVIGPDNPLIIEHLATVEAELGNDAAAARLRASLQEQG